MTRPELPPGYCIRPGKPGTIWLTIKGVDTTEVNVICSTDFSGDRHGLIGTAWAIWTAANPEWAAYLEQIESETDR